MNGKPFVEQKVPSLYTVLDAGKEATNPVIYGEYANPFVINYNDVVEVVINNGDSGGHPIHMHGHNFQMVERSPAYNTPHKAPATPTTNLPPTPIRRDVMKVMASGYLVYRFRADNPDKSSPPPSPANHQTNKPLYASGPSTATSTGISSRAFSPPLSKPRSRSKRKSASPQTSTRCARARTFPIRETRPATRTTIPI